MSGSFAAVLSAAALSFCSQQEEGSAAGEQYVTEPSRQKKKKKKKQKPIADKLSVKLQLEIYCTTLVSAAFYLH